MKSSIKSLVATLLIGGALMGFTDTAYARLFSKKKKEVKKELTQAQKDSVELNKHIGEAKESYKGMFDFFIDKEGKLTMLIPDSAFNETYLLVSRVNSISNTSELVAGQMNVSPLAVTFSKDDTKVYLHLLQANDLVSDNDPLKASFERNIINPVVKGFKIKSKFGGKTLIDVTDFFCGNDKLISPLQEVSPLARALTGDSGIEGTYYADGSSITSVKAFPDNVMIGSRLAYTTKKATEPYTVSVTRSLLRLPAEPMRMRLQDNRVGYFYDTKREYSSTSDKLERYKIINRFRIEPKEEDMDAYLRGELVEPKKPIIFYVDSAFPKKWADAVKEGIEYWNIAFEAAGFKNAIEARDYPADNSEFDPDDIRFNCVRYCVTPTANAMGPSYCDPRSGEIIGADVIWYHNVLSLVHNWRFAQTAAVDPRVRKKVFDDSVMYESLTYVAAHEIGHCLGLMHNMGASYAYTLDNLRDPAFTQKYGTTPSIMDYARNNFVAQPGDLERGVRMTPPPVGVYDIHAINWGYRLIPEAKDMFEERPILNQWIAEKEGDPMYEFGAQQFLGLIDPTDQTEDLGNDHIKAGSASISNLKIIIANLEDWAGEKDSNYDPLLETYKAVINQYLRHVGHVFPYIGGCIYKEIRQGRDDGPMRTFISKADTKRAIDWLLDQARTCDWLEPIELVEKFEETPRWKENLQKSIIGCFFSSVNMNRIKRSHQINPDNHYSLSEYMDDVTKGIFAATLSEKKLTDTERNLQSLTIDAFANASGLPGVVKAASSKKSAVETYEETAAMLASPTLPCSLDAGDCAHLDPTKSFFRLAMGDPALPAHELQPMMTARLKKLLSVYRAAKAPDASTKEFYDYQIKKINHILNAD